MRVISLSSGSKGNATLVETDGVALLVDCGLSLKALADRLVKAGLEPDDTLTRIAGVLVTHSHADHVCGLRPLLKRHPDIPIYANSMTAETIETECKIPSDVFACFENGQTFALGPFAIKAFSIPHDTSDPVGYLLKADIAYFHGTDIGSPLDSVGVNLAEAEFATLESNHDPVMLHNSGRPPAIIQRIYGPRGHLANDQAAELVRRFASPRLKRIALAHLSHDCNVPHLAENEVRGALKKIGREDVVVKVLSQDIPVEL